MEKIDEKLANLIEKLQEAGFAQAPEVIDGAIRAIYWDGVVQLTVVGLFFGLLLLAILVLLYGLSLKRDGEAIALVGGFGAALSAVTVVSVGLKSNPWLKTFDPEAALYQQIIGGLF